jgi:hypothetical protein
MTKQNTATIGHNVAPATIRELTKKWAANKGREFAAKLVLVDLIKAEGGTVENLKDKEHALHKDINAGIIDNFPTPVEKLLALNKADAKKLPKTAPKGTPPSKDYKSKAGRKYWQQQVGSYRGKIVAAMTPRKSASNIVRKDDNQWFAEWLNDGLKRAKNPSRSFEGLKCDIAELTTWMNHCPLGK